MTTRTDVDYDLSRSPRVAEVATPSIEMVMQDYVDTTRIEESSFAAMSHPKLMNASGKEVLDANTSVAITVSEQDLKLSFQARTTTASTGTATSNSAAPVRGEITLTDTAGTFQTDSVVRGSLVINFTDMSVADVTEVVSETVLHTKTLVNGTDNSYDIGDVYHIFNIIQVKTTGGNLVAVDALDVTFPAILPTAFTQVIQTSASSGTISEQEDIEFASFLGGVTVDTGNTTGNATAGVVFPTGTPRQPCDNITDAHSILTTRGFNQFFIRGNVTITGGTHSHHWIGESPSKTTIVLNAGALLDDIQFSEATLSGPTDTNTQIQDCDITSLTNFNGRMRRCGFKSGTTTLGGADDTEIINCWSEVGGGGSTPIIDMGGSGQGLLMRGYSGGIQINNRTGTDAVSIDLISGQVIIDATCTAGTITLRGVGKVTDNSGVGCTVVNEMVNSETIGTWTWDALLTDHSVTGSFGEFIVRRLLTVAKFFSLRT